MALEVYPLAAVLRAAYKVTDRAYLFIHPTADGAAVDLYLQARRDADDPALLVGPLCNELLDQAIRLDLEREAGPLRELIVAQAFAEGNLLDPERDDGDYHRDPLGIGLR